MMQYQVGGRRGGIRGRGKVVKESKSEGPRHSLVICIMTDVYERGAGNSEFEERRSK